MVTRRWVDTRASLAEREALSADKTKRSELVEAGRHVSGRLGLGQSQSSLRRRAGIPDDASRPLRWRGRTKSPRCPPPSSRRVDRDARTESPDAFVAASDAFVAASDAFVATRDAFFAARDAFVADDAALVALREAFVEPREAFFAAREAFFEPREAFAAARDAFLAARDALVADRDTRSALQDDKPKSRDAFSIVRDALFVNRFDRTTTAVEFSVNPTKSIQKSHVSLELPSVVAALVEYAAS
jgi:hypothetical protein